MAITTFEGLRTGIKPDEIRLVQKASIATEGASNLTSLFRVTGTPDPGAVPAGGLAGLALSAPVTGQIPIDTAAPLGIYLAGIKHAAATSNGIIIADRLWENSGIVVTTLTAQTINSVAWPARATVSDGVMVGIDVSTATTNIAGVTTITMSYTNSDGTAGRTATISFFPATCVANTLVLFELQAGDTGVQSIQSITLGTSLVAGAIHLVALKVITAVTSDLPKAKSFNFLATGMPLLTSNVAVPFVIAIPSTTATGIIMLDIIFAQG